MTATLPSNGLLAPYLKTEQAVRLAARVISSMPPRELPNATPEFKCFGELISRVATAAVPTHLKVKCALAAWPFARHLEKESCFSQAQLFTGGVRVDGYQFTSVKDFDSLLNIDHHGRYFHKVANGCIVFKVTSIKDPLPAAILLMAFMPNVAHPLDPCNWIMSGLLRDPKNSEADKIHKAALTLVSIANASYRPYS